MRLMVPAALLFAVSACGIADLDRNDQTMVLASETGFQPPAGQGGGVKSFLPQGSVTRGGNAVHWITPNGCTYSRTQAPGYAPVWYLVQNPHHVGMPNAHRGCPNAVAEGL